MDRERYRHGKRGVIWTVVKRNSTSERKEQHIYLRVPYSITEVSNQKFSSVAHIFMKYFVTYLLIDSEKRVLCARRKFDNILVHIMCIGAHCTFSANFLSRNDMRDIKNMHLDEMSLKSQVVQI